MFSTILYPDWEKHEKPRAETMPECFGDLNLDQIVAPLLRNNLNRGLDSFFYTPPDDIETVLFRQEVMKDLENTELRAVIEAFSRQLVQLEEDASQVRGVLTAKTTYENDYLSRGKLMELAEIYCGLVTELDAAMDRFSPASAGLRDFKEYLKKYASSPEIGELKKRISELRSGFAEVRYCMFIKGDTIKIRKYEGQARLAESVQAIFERFKCEGLPDYNRHFSQEPSSRKVEALLLEKVAELHPQLFEELEKFCERYLRFEDQSIVLFVREVRFYLAWLDFTDGIAEQGLSFCYPELCTSAEELYDYDFFDLALAAMIGGKTVPNDFELRNGERIMVITGPNQGGKTTFTRSFGQAHWLGSLGLRVQGRRAKLLMFDKILTHFEKEEDLVNLSGKLQDDLIRLKKIMDQGTERSIFLINEIFTSTTLADAVDLSGYMMDALETMGSPTIIVTFLEELAGRGKGTVSMVSLMKDTMSEERSFKIVRRAPDGKAHAMQIAALHNLTYEQIKRRLEQ